MSSEVTIGDVKLGDSNFNWNEISWDQMQNFTRNNYDRKCSITQPKKKETSRYYFHCLGAAGERTQVYQTVNLF